MPSGRSSREKAQTLPTAWKWRSSPRVAVLAKHPLMGSKRQDITPRPLRFWTITKFPSYVIVYRPETVPLQVVAVLHGQRDLKEVLERRS
jgi:plasmid stabilization system protein ParE